MATVNGLVLGLDFNSKGIEMYRDLIPLSGGDYKRAAHSCSQRLLRKSYHANTCPLGLMDKASDF